MHYAKKTRVRLRMSKKSSKFAAALNSAQCAHKKKKDK
jgi:hypothetical protein